MSKKIRAADGKVTIKKWQDLYLRGEKISMMTCYDYTMARLIDGAGIDAVLVGDSLGMVVQGHSSTLPVSIDHMVYHVECVARGIERAHLMADLPFMSYQVSHDEAVHNAGRLIKAGAESVKLEGGDEIADLIWYMNRIGIPVMAHIGLKPQCIHTMGGYKIQGKSKSDAEAIIGDAKIMEEAGAFSLLLEGIPLEVAKEITETVSIPTTGIGSGPHCSGQVLVMYDVIGADPDFKPRFVRHYMNFADEMKSAVQKYISDVRHGNFPNESESVHRNLVEVKNDSKQKKK